MVAPPSSWRGESSMALRAEASHKEPGRALPTPFQQTLSGPSRYRGAPGRRALDLPVMTTNRIDRAAACILIEQVLGDQSVPGYEVGSIEVEEFPSVIMAGPIVLLRRLLPENSSSSPRRWRSLVPIRSGPAVAAGVIVRLSRTHGTRVPSDNRVICSTMVPAGSAPWYWSQSRNVPFLKMYVRLPL